MANYQAKLLLRPVLVLRSSSYPESKITHCRQNEKRYLVVSKKSAVVNGISRSRYVGTGSCSNVRRWPPDALRWQSCRPHRRPRQDGRLYNDDGLPGHQTWYYDKCDDVDSGDTVENAQNAENYRPSVVSFHSVVSSSSSVVTEPTWNKQQHTLFTSKLSFIILTCR